LVQFDDEKAASIFLGRRAPLTLDPIGWAVRGSGEPEINPRISCLLQVPFTLFLTAKYLEELADSGEPEPS